MLMITQAEVKAVYEALADATRVAFWRNEAAVTAKTALEAARAGLLATGDVEGKNEAQREASLRLKLQQHFEALEAAERDARDARFVLELARIGVEQMRVRLRMSEVAAQGGEA